MKTLNTSRLFLGIALIGAILLSGVTACGSNAPKNKEAQWTAPVTVAYFHGKQRCVSCLAIEKAARESVSEGAYGQQVAFQSIDLSTPEGEAIADKYKISFSTLLVIKKANGQQSETTVDLTDDGFSKARNHADEFKQQIKDQIDRMLKP